VTKIVAGISLGPTRRDDFQSVDLRHLISRNTKLVASESCRLRIVRHHTVHNLYFRIVLQKSQNPLSSQRSSIRRSMLEFSCRYQSGRRFLIEQFAERDREPHTRRFRLQIEQAERLVSSIQLFKPGLCVRQTDALKEKPSGVSSSVLVSSRLRDRVFARHETRGW